MIITLAAKMTEISPMKSAGDFRVPVRTLLEVVLYVGKGAKFGVHKVNSGRDIGSRVVGIGNWNFEKQAQSSKQCF